MRTNTKYNLRDGASILLQFFIGRFSLWYFRNISNKRITLIRRQGIGDAIFCTGVLDEFKKKNTKTQVKLVSNHPNVFSHKSENTYSLSDFPFVWLMYGHYDFGVFRRKDKHITKIAAEFLGLPPDNNYDSQIEINETAHDKFVSEFIKGKKYIVIHPWAGHWNTQRNWSKGNWDNLVQMLQEEGYLIYQIGGKEDLHIDGAKPFNGIATLDECFVLIKNAKLFIGVNSFAEQAAGAFKVRSVILYGPTNPVYSLNKNQVAISGNKVIDHSLLSNLTYEFDIVDNINCRLVYEQAINLLEKSKG